MARQSAKFLSNGFIAAQRVLTTAKPAQHTYVSARVASSYIVASLWARPFRSADPIQRFGHPKSLAFDVLAEVNLHAREGLRKTVPGRRNIRQKNALETIMAQRAFY